MPEERPHRSSNDKLRNIMVPVGGAGWLLTLWYAGSRIVDLLTDGRIFSKGAWRYPADGISFYVPAVMVSLMPLVSALLILLVIKRLVRESRERPGVYPKTDQGT